MSILLGTANKRGTSACLSLLMYHRKESEESSVDATDLEGQDAGNSRAEMQLCRFEVPTTSLQLKPFLFTPAPHHPVGLTFTD